MSCYICKNPCAGPINLPEGDKIVCSAECLAKLQHRKEKVIIIDTILWFGAMMFIATIGDIDPPPSKL